MDARAAGITHCVISVEARDRYSPDEGGDCDIGVKGRVLHEGELDGNDGIEDDGGEEDMGGLGECGLCGGGAVGWERAGSPYQSQLEKLEAPCEVKAEIQHYSHGVPPTDWSLN
jgi:hypothetical protein